MEVKATTKTENYLDALQRTQGAWVRENWKSLREKRRKTEIVASRKRKHN